MDTFFRAVLGLVAAASIVPLTSFATCHVSDAISRAETLSAEAYRMKEVLVAVDDKTPLAWNSMKLSQSAERLPLVLASGSDEFSVERKFVRLSDLFHTVRNESIDLLYFEAHPEIEFQLGMLELAYLDLANALGY